MNAMELTPFFYGPWHGQRRRVARRPRVLVPVPTRSMSLVASESVPPNAPDLDFVTYELRQDERGKWAYVCLDDRRRWTIAVITQWAPEIGEYDELFRNEASVEAFTAEEAERLYGDAHPWDRDYCTISARPEGQPW